MEQVKQEIAAVFREMSQGLLTGAFGRRIRVGLTLQGSEHGEAELLRGAELAQAADSSIEVVVIGSPAETQLTLVEAASDKEGHAIMDKMLDSGELDAAVTMHYSFPIGVSTVGRVVTPAWGKTMLIANTTGTADTERAAALLKNTISGLAVAKACGNPQPTVGILNIEGARQLERNLNKLQENGYDLRFSASNRADGGVVMRGNDLLQGAPDVMVMDSLTGNVMIKLLSAYTSGGSYEALGDGYGPGVGEGWKRIINIISRASGAPVIAGAVRFAAACAKGRLPEVAEAEFAAARKAGFQALLDSLNAPTAKPAAAEIQPPPAKIVTADIPGIEILDLEDAVRALWQQGIFASSGMGCTGPIILVAPEDKENAVAALKTAGYL